LLARWTLQELAKEHELCRILEREGREFPELLPRMKDSVVQRAYREAADFIRRRLDDLGLPEQDCEALAAIALGALVNYRAEEGLFGEPPAGVDEERFIKTWVDLWATFAQAAGRRPPAERKEGQRPSGNVRSMARVARESARRKRDRG
jgi:hypothetical protein